MATYIVRVHGRGDGLRGVVSDVTTQESRTFIDAAELLAALAGSPEPQAGPVEPLTKSQLRVCRLAAVGKSNTAIAAELFVSRATVESHLHAAYRKLGIGSRFALPMALIDVAARAAA
jgi:DNA-binding NarL/FixJ family response regulator